MAFSFTDFLFSLFESAEGLSPYAFHVKYKASPYEVSTFIVEGLRKHLLSFDFESNRISLSTEGRKEALKAYYYKAKEQRKLDAKIPLVFLDSLSTDSQLKLKTDFSDLIKRRERTSIEETSRFRFRVKAE